MWHCLCNTHEHIHIGLSTYGTFTGMNGARRQKKGFFFSSKKKEDAVKRYFTIGGFSKWNGLTVTFWHRNWLFHFDYSMQLNCCLTVATSKAMPIRMHCNTRYDAFSCMAHIRQTLGSSVRQCFKHGNAFEIHNRRIFNFHMRLHIFS